MDSKRFVKILKGYVIYGLLIGGLVTAFFYASFALFADMSLNEVKGLVPVMYLIDFIPVIFGLVYFFTGVNMQNRRDRIYSRLKKQIEIVERTSLFAEDIGKGELESDFHTMGNDDDLGKALLKMRESLKSQAKEEEERNWIVEGTSEIGSILRNHNKVKELGDAILQYLVPKMDSLQGAFYTAKESEISSSLRPRGDISLVASYAYGRKKYLDAKLKFGQGLVGQAAAERDVIYRKEIPESYVSITSGLVKDKKPNTILIIPLIADHQMYGLIEFASLNQYSERQVKFLREVSTIIARTLFNIATNEKTLDLLDKVNKSQERTQVLLANASEVISIYDEESKIKYVSPSVEQILGYQPEEIEGTSDAERLKEGKEVFDSLFEKLLANPIDSVMGQYSYLKKNGDEVWLETSGQNLTDNESINGILFNTRDITERRQAEKEQRERAKMQALSENSPDIIIRFDMLGYFSYVNPAIETYTGINALEFLNKNIADVELDDNIRNDFNKFRAQVNEAQSKLAAEMKFPTQSAELYMEVNCMPEFNEDLELESILMVVHDITEAKEAEEAVKEANMKVMDSINYAKRIQGSMLPKAQVIKNHFEKSFMYFRPRDLVSGDFPFFHSKGDWMYVAAVDCTGHGVPGALLSIIGTMILTDTLKHNDELSASELNDLLHEGVVSTLRQGQEGGENERDGMDIAMCKINLKTGDIEYSGAHRPLYILRNDHNGEDDLFQFKGDKYPIGGVQYKGREKFINYKDKLNKGDRIYFFSDGYPDQFESKGLKKIGPKRIRKMLVNMKDDSMENIEAELDRYFKEWQGTYYQMDDVLFIGLEF